jgi:hypothetical protein
VGQTYTFFYWVKSISANSNTVGTRANIGIQFNNVASFQIQSGSTLAPLPNAGWQQVIYNFVPNNNCVNIELFNNNTSSTGNNFAITLSSGANSVSFLNPPSTGTIFGLNMFVSQGAVGTEAISISSSQVYVKTLSATGSLYGTASWAQNTQTASQAQNIVVYGKAAQNIAKGLVVRVSGASGTIGIGGVEWEAIYFPYEVEQEVLERVLHSRATGAGNELPKIKEHMADITASGAALVWTNIEEKGIGGKMYWYDPQEGLSGEEAYTNKEAAELLKSLSKWIEKE